MKLCALMVVAKRGDEIMNQNYNQGDLNGFGKLA